MWRISLGDPYGMHVWFDPSEERVEIYGLTQEEKCRTLDRIGSVSGLTETETPASEDQIDLL